MKIDQLRYFSEAARLQHIGKAGEALNVSRSAVSNAVAALEAELKCDLFDRLPKKIVLTAAGNRLNKEAREILRKIDDLTHVVNPQGAGLSGDYRISASHFLAQHLLAPLWISFQEEHDDLRVEMFSSHTGEILSQIVSGKIDYGLCFGPFSHPQIDQRVIHTGDIVFAVRKHHPILSQPKASRLKRLSSWPAAIHKEHPWIDSCETHPLFKKLGLEPNICFSYDNDDFGIQKITASDAWIFAPEVILRNYADDLHIFPKHSGWSAQYSVSLAKHQSRRVDELWSVLHESLTDRILELPH